ncbi:FAD-binding oxidoreductase, partial [Mesorhizobium sp. CU2]|uniref:NAD(P)/FAD-dependent oxidoreductase n=2 Tax=unclassified Mesorhizobium TaxID=325217 RepID=UPI00112AB921
DSRAVTELTGIRGYVGGWMDKSGGVLNPVEFARGLADAAERAGARIFERTRVTSIDRLPDGWALKAATGTVRAGKVLVATNAYGDALNPVLALTYVPLTVFQIATEPLPRDLRARLLPGGQGVGDTRRNLFTCRFDGQNRLISGGMHIIGAGAERRVPQAIWRRLARHLDLADLPPIAYSWTGVAAIEPDFLPRLIDLGPDMIAGFGCNGRGIAMTTAMGKALADWASGADAHDLPLPSAPPSPIPLHGVVRYAPNVMLAWSILRDRMEGASHNATKAK